MNKEEIMRFVDGLIRKDIDFLADLADRKKDEPMKSWKEYDEAIIANGKEVHGIDITEVFHRPLGYKFRHGGWIVKLMLRQKGKRVSLDAEISRGEKI